MHRSALALAGLLAAALLLLPLAAAAADPRPGEITEYQGQKLSPYDRHYDNSIKGAQKIDRQAYRLEVGGLVDKPLSLSYPEILALASQTRVENMPCVEGWDERLLFQGVAVADLLALAGARPQGSTVIFRAADGYSSALPLAYVQKAQVLLAYKVNGLELGIRRGFPLQVVAPHKLGYKWVKWVTAVELTDQPHLGYWEKKGYSDQADTPR
ncbi:MAG: molybdopterin-dependent oxidoreductase [Desulfarculus sp.]|nr:molybdopterin-dependent oxidoreductase [Desulfarculus sp.]